MAQSGKTASGGPQAVPANRVPPANDNFANATNVTATGVYLSSVVEATSQAGEPVVPSSCATGDSNQSVWFKIVATNTTPLSIDTDGSEGDPSNAQTGPTDTIMSLYSGTTLAGLTLVACNDDDATNDPGDFTSRIANIPVTVGTTYYVRVSSYAPGRVNGTVQLTVTGAVVATAGEGTADNARSALSSSPNPVRSAARVRFTTAQAQDVSVTVLDVTGREVLSLYRGLVAADQEQTFSLSATSLPAGIYVVRALGSTVNLSQRVTVVR